LGVFFFSWGGGGGGGALLFGQFSGSPRSRPTSSLRATAILELAPDGRARLVPIVIKAGDKFFDGGLYRADPSPMALLPGTVYDAERSGDSVGLFTVTQSQEMGGVWVGLGQWRSQTASQAGNKPAEAALLHTRNDDESDERPVLRRPKPAAAPSPSPAPTASPAAEPKLAAGSKPAATPEVTPQAQEDPNRPVLRRGKPVSHESADELPPMIAGKPGAAHSMPGASAAKGVRAQPAGAGVEVLTAVSDAGGPTPRPYTMQLAPGDSERYEKAVGQMAYAAIGKFAAEHASRKPAAATEMTGVQFHVYDANLNNEPEFVFSAALPELLPPGVNSRFHYLVTVVARVDIYGELHQLLAQVTDTTHLDAYPQLELIDVVDAEGSGAGQLLFREISDTGYDFALYRVGADKLWLLFQGGGGSF